ncbi:protein of unknown function [Jatrophihabitans endophyticus]|uniref:Uncharacterized protein n=1 Tax=Jatrophihabitans endophyticus TaxID=1206085 RepID=A0A1M5PIB7_9ACTN|nr:DUF2017 family protein [Jatrophihabitans endophyticus]SHH01497.1 protein of unknown function [Jatrophihabitans endophyticus]
MRIRRRPLRLAFTDVEAQLLTGLLDDLGTLLAAEDADDPVQQRLFPAAYPDDGDAEAEYRGLTESSLRDERVERIAACVAELARDATVTLGGEDVSRRWLQVLNDLRLALGTRLGVTEEPPAIDPTDPEAQPWLIYDWLTGVQDAVVTALMR